ncbi:MAG: adenylate/guanylate cyclase domain-containing protein [Actinomycetota bacterium]
MRDDGVVIEGEPVELTFLFTDMQGSTGLWDRYPVEMVAVISLHDALLADAIDTNKGVLIGKTGDGVVAGFASPHDALQAAVESQHALAAAAWDPIPELLVRMGLHTGPVFRRGDEYHGQGINLSSRLHAAGHGGQILVSDITAELLGDIAPPLSLTDLGVHRLRDFAEPIRLHQVTGPGLASEFPRLRSKETGPPPLPSPPARPIGRDDEIVQLGRLVGDRPVVTIIGSPGVGKSRLGIEVANLRRDGFASGAKLCSLAGVDESQVGVVIAASVDVEPPADTDITNAIVDALRNEELLLVIDNAEQDASVLNPIIDQIVARCRRVSILATRNSPTGAAGETVFRLEPLPTGPDSAADQLYRHFAQLAGADDESLHDDAITDLCRHLDGLPMAIELAASATVAQSPSEILASIRSGDDARISAAVTLDDTVSWSVDALPAEHLRLLSAASVFAGGFTADTVAEIAGIDEMATVHPLLAQLCDQSLVRSVRVGSTTRFQLLEPIRLHLRARLEPDERERLLDAHMALMTELAVTGGAAKRGHEEKRWARRLDAELDNLRAAHARAVDRNDHDAALGMANALWDVGFMGLNYEVFDWAERAADRAPDDHPTLAAVAGIVALGAWARDERSKGTEYAEMALSAEERTGGPHTLPVRLAMLNSSAYTVHRKDTGEVYEELVAASNGTKEPYWIVNAMVVASIGQSMAGDANGARDVAADALRLARKSDNPSSIAWALFALGTAAEDLDHAYAASCLSEAINVARDVDNRWVTAMAQTSLASTRRRADDPAGAATQLIELLDLWIKVGHQSHAWHAVRLAALILGEAGQTDAMLLLDRAAQAADFVMPMTSDQRRELAERSELAVKATDPEEVQRLDLQALLMDLPDAANYASRRLETLL